MYLLVVSFAFYFLNYAAARDNGVGRTPPLGWMSWTKFGCKVDCNAEPENCISERLIVDMADRLAEDGYRDAGWEYLVIDDCWASKSRDKDGNLLPDPARFPHGIKWLSDYVHGRGLKFGIYAGYGDKTCMGYPGTMRFVERDIAKFVEWQVDYLKLDACYSDPRTHERGFAEFGARLTKATLFAPGSGPLGERPAGRPIYFSCSYPFYMLLNRIGAPRPDVLQDTCNSWRIFDDVALKFDSVWRISEFWATDQLGMREWGGPGHFNDADMLLIGNDALTIGEARIQFAVWIVISSPLFLSNDLRNLAFANETRNILLNRNLIDIARDPLAHSGRRVKHERNLQVWIKRIALRSSYAVAIVNCAYRPATVVQSDYEKDYAKQNEHVYWIRFGELGLENKFGYNVTELFSDTYYGVVYPDEFRRFTVARNDAQLYRFAALQESDPEADYMRHRLEREQAANAAREQAAKQRRMDTLREVELLRLAPASTGVGFKYGPQLFWLLVIFGSVLLFRCLFPRKFRNCLGRLRVNTALRRL